MRLLWFVERATACAVVAQVVQVQMGPFLTQQQQEVPSKARARAVEGNIRRFS